MTANWSLIQPGRRYSRVPAPDNPVARELRALATRDRAAGSEPADWPQEERERWMGDMRSSRAYMAYYEPARWPERIQAPMAWPEELLLIALSVALTAALSDPLPEALWVAIVLHPTWEALGGIETELRRRSARRLGVTPETLPPLSTVYGGIFFFAGTLGTLTWRTRRGPRATRTRWHLYLAIRLISAVNERRSWRQATRDLR
jgi:hypothetical protein